MMIDNLLQDVRYGIRILLKSPVYTLTAFILLSVGIGANTAIFSLLNAILFRPLPVKQPDALVGIYQTFKNQPSNYGFSYPDFIDLRKRSSVFTDLAAASFFPAWMTEGESSFALNGKIVSSSYFSVLDIEPHIGRFFYAEEESAPGKSPVAVISYDLWRTRFHGDPKMLGQTIRLNRIAFTIIGVAPKGFNGIHFEFDAQVWIPTTMGALLDANQMRLDRVLPTFDIFGRLKPGKSIQQGESEFKVLVKQIIDENPGSTSLTPAVQAEPLRAVPSWMRDLFTGTPKLLFAASACMLLIVCANLAGLFLVRGTARRSELAVRLALGAGRNRLIGQLLVESMILSLLGFAGGLVIAAWWKDWITIFVFNWITFDLDFRVVLFAAVLSTFTGLLSGLPAALFVTPKNLSVHMKQGRSASSRGSVLRSSLIIAQISLSFILLSGAVLVFRSIVNMLTRPGYDSKNIAHFEISPGRSGYDQKRAALYYKEVLRRVQSLPNVQDAALMSSSYVGSNFVKEKITAPDIGNNEIRVAINEITPGFMKFFKIPVIQGREFEEKDVDGAPRVAIVNEMLARQFWPTGSPIGRKLIVGKKEHEIVGVIPDLLSLQARSGPLLYLSCWQRRSLASHLLVRTYSNAGGMIPKLRREILNVDPDVHIKQESTFTELTLKSIGNVRILAVMLGFNGIIALLLSAIGLYGLLAFLVNLQKREIGVRIALGAQKDDVVLFVGKHGLKLAVTGIVIGLIGASFSARVLNRYLIGIQPSDAFSFIAAATTFIVVSMLACYLPAKHAAKIEPAVALREE